MTVIRARVFAAGSEPVRQAWNGRAYPALRLWFAFTSRFADTGTCSNAPARNANAW